MTPVLLLLLAGLGVAAVAANSGKKKSKPSPAGSPPAAGPPIHSVYTIYNGAPPLPPTKEPPPAQEWPLPQAPTPLDQALQANVPAGADIYSDTYCDDIYRNTSDAQLLERLRAARQNRVNLAELPCLVYKLYDRGYRAESDEAQALLDDLIA